MMKVLASNEIQSGLASTYSKPKKVTPSHRVYTPEKI